MVEPLSPTGVVCVDDIEFYEGEEVLMNESAFCDVVGYYLSVVFSSKVMIPEDDIIVGVDFE